MAESVEQLGYEMTAQALTEQERALTGLWACAGTVLAAASVAGSVLGARAMHDSLDVWGTLALLAFVGCLSSAILVLLPHQLVFAFRGEVLVSAGDRREQFDVEDAYRAAGGWIQPHLQLNRRTIGRLSKCLTASCVLLAIEVVLWILSVAS